MKKILSFALCIVMVLGLLSGCQKPMDAKTLTQKIDEAYKNQTAMAAVMNMELEMSVGIAGINMDMGYDMTMDMKADLAKGNIYVDMNADMEVLGEAQNMSMEIYYVTEGDTMTMYMYEGEAGTWIKSEGEVESSETEMLTSGVIAMSEIPEEKMTLAEEKELVNDRQCYVLTMDLDGAYFNDSMKQALGAGMEMLNDVSDNVDWSALNAKMVYHVDAETFLPVQITGEIQGMGEGMESVMLESMGELAAILGDEELTVDVPVFKIAMTDMAFADVEVPPVPQEAIDADDLLDYEGYIDGNLMTNPPRSDGSFILSYGGSRVRVMPPEGYFGVDSMEEMLYIGSVDDEIEVAYELTDGVSDEFMREVFEEAVSDAQISDLYLSHTELAEVNGFTVGTLIFNDGTFEGYAWKMLGSNAIIVCAYGYGDSVDMEIYTNTLEVVE